MSSLQQIGSRLSESWGINGNIKTGWKINVQSNFQLAQNDFSLGSLPLSVL